MQAHYQDSYFYHASCTPLKAVKWMLKRWPGVGEIQAAHANVVTAAQLREIQLVFDSNPVDAPTGEKRKRVRREHRPSKEQQEEDRAELEAMYPVGRKGVVSVRRDLGRYQHGVTNHFVQVTRCTPKFVEVREYEHSSQLCFQDSSVVLTRVQADWERPREVPVFGAYHRIEKHRLTGVFGGERQCRPLQGRVQTCYLFEGDFISRDDHGATSAEIEPGDDGDAVHVRTMSGELLLRMPELQARESVVRDIIRGIEDRVGTASEVQILSGSVLLKPVERLSPLLTEGECLVLTAIFKARPVRVDAKGREYPRIAEFLDGCRPTHPAVKSVDEAFDHEPWIR